MRSYTCLNALIVPVLLQQVEGFAGPRSREPISPHSISEIGHHRCVGGSSSSSSSSTRSSALVLHGFLARNGSRSSSTISPPYEAEELLSLLLAKHRNKAGATSKDDINRIENLMQSLAKQNLPFDPTTSLDGPLFAVLHQSGPVPFWEAYDFDLGALLFGGKKNIKGQMYTLMDDGDGVRSESGSGGTIEQRIRVTNYAEFIGEDFSVQAVGVARRNVDRSGSSTRSISTSTSDASKFEGLKEVKENRSIKSIITGIFKKRDPSTTRKPKRSRSRSSDSNLVTCPADYTVQVTNAYVSILGNKLDIDINGTGYLRVLYADENLRIFTTPKDTTDSKIDEKAGLTVAQVRIDLVNQSSSSPSKNGNSIDKL
jgi:hypothetical protein